MASKADNETWQRQVLSHLRQLLGQAESEPAAPMAPYATWQTVCVTEPLKRPQARPFVRAKVGDRKLILGGSSSDLL